MEQKDIDIYEILKGAPFGTKLYSPMCGNVGFNSLASNKEAGEAIWTNDKNGEYSFNKNGRYMEEGEVMLFPSDKMRDWSKFFKKGDVLVHRNGDVHVIFEGFKNNCYTRFKCKHYLWKEYFEDYSKEKSEMITFLFKKVSDDEAQTYINTLEKHFGGKLNRETLEIEKAQPDFKDGDIVSLEIRYIDSEDVIAETYILHGDYHNGENLNFYAGYRDNITDKVIYNSFVRPDKTSVRKELLRYATEEEKQQLFDALEKEGKRWDSEKKQIVDLKPAFEVGKLYVFNEDDEDGELTIIGELIAKNESEDTLTFGNQYEIENEKFVTDQTFDLRISVNKELREATEGEVELFNKHYDIWKNGKEEREQPAFKTFDKVLVRDGGEYEWLPALFVRDRGEGANYRYKVLSLRSGKPAEFACCIPYEGNENIIFTDHNIDNLPF